MSLCVGRVLIVGAGLAGLSAAIALSARGADVTVVDLTEDTDGASISITNRAVHALELLGVLDACVAAGVTPAPGRTLFSNMMNAAGEPLPIPPPPARPDDRLPALVAIYRPTLARIMRMAAEAGGARIFTGVTFSALEDVDDGVEVTLSDRSRDRFDLVIGADGTRSAVRALIMPDVRPVYTGWMSFRLMIADAPLGQAGFFMQPDGDMIATTRLPGNLLYLAAGEKMASRHIAQDEALVIVDRILARYPAPLIQGVKARLPDKPHVLVRPFDSLIAPSPWRRGRVAIIGDAAHSTAPTLSSGGSMAIEDGVVLAEELARGADVNSALQAFVDRRYERTRMVVEQSLALLQLQERGAHPREGAMMRQQAVTALMQPF